MNVNLLRGMMKFTNVCLKHVVVFLLGAEGLLQDCYVPLVVLVLFLEGLHLGRHCQDLLVSPCYLGTELLQLLGPHDNRHISPIRLF